MTWRDLSNAQFNWMTVCFLKWLSCSFVTCFNTTVIFHGIYLAPIELGTVLSTSQTATRDHKSVQIPNHRKLIGSPTKIWMRSLTHLWSCYPLPEGSIQFQKTPKMKPLSAGELMLVRLPEVGWICKCLRQSSQTEVCATGNEYGEGGNIAICLLWNQSVCSKSDAAPPWYPRWFRRSTSASRIKFWR